MPQRFFASCTFRALFMGWLLVVACGLRAQQEPERTRQFLAQRSSQRQPNAAALLTRAHAQQAQTFAHPRVQSFSVPWQPLGPDAVVSPTYGNLTGRITALALDPNDTAGNTLYVGTTGGGVWKSTNAASAGASFIPLTDTLPVFAAGTSTIPSLSIGAVAVQPVANPVVLAGTGDPNDATDSYYGEGLLRSTDGGVTWTLLQESHDGVSGNHSFLGLASAGIAFSSSTPTLVVAGFGSSVEGSVVNAANIEAIPGLYYSTDAGQTWQMATVYDGTAVVQQPEPAVVGGTGYAATSVVYDPLRKAFFAAIQYHGYYSSTDGATWQRLNAQPGTKLTVANCPTIPLSLPGNCPVYRGALAVRPVTGDLYALTVDANGNDQGLWQDLCGAVSGSCSDPAPAFAARIDAGALEVGGGSTAIAQGTYNLALAAAPAAANGTLLFAGTVDLYRCAIAANATACALRNTTNAVNGCSTNAGVAPAQHALAAQAQVSGAPALFLGNDGGLWSSLDGVAETGPVCSPTDASHFNNLNAGIGSLAELVGFAEHPTDPDTLLAGLGANGSAATSTATSLAPWPQLSVGEGGYPALDASTSNNWYLSIGAGVDVKRCALGASCRATDFVTPATIGETQVADDVSLLDAPLLLDPGLSTNVFVGTCRVWRGPAAGGSWTAGNAISPVLDGASPPCTAASPLIRSIAAGGPVASSSNAQNAGSTVIYAGLAGLLDGGANIPGHVFVTKVGNAANSTTAWTDVAVSPVTNDSFAFNVGGFDVSSLFVDSHDTTGATVYATIMGFGVAHLYRSTDFGAHWLNVSANLPDAPANAVLVDPNGANTVYVATDAGVYATTAITTCSLQNCWSPLGTRLPNAPAVALQAAANMPTGDGHLGMLRVGTYGRGIWQQPLLNEVVVAQPAITLSANSFTFGPQQVATQSVAQMLTVTSSGNAAVTIGSLNMPPDFVETDNCAGQTLAVNATCQVQITFVPTATGTRSGTLTMYDNAPGGQSTVLLAGTGTTPPAITFSPPSLSFPVTVVNSTAAVQNIVVSNGGGTMATLQTPVITGDFAISANTCAATLAASSGCTLSIVFTPTASGTRTGTLSLTDSAGMQTAVLSGAGEAPATDTLGTTSLTFTQQQVGTSSVVQQVTLTNAGGVPLTLIAASVNAPDFTVVNNCGASLNGQASCSISVEFAPTATGTRTATLTVADEFRSQTVSLSGVGVAPAGVSLSPAALSFGAIGVGLTAQVQTLTLTNNGGLPLSITSMSVSASFAIAATTCSSTLAVNAACTLSVVFSPTAAGVVSGVLTLVDNAPSGSQTVVLSGTGVDFSLAATGPTTQTMSGTASATYALEASSIAGLSGSIALACAGVPQHATCTVSPQTAVLGGSTSVLVTVETGATAQVIAPRWRMLQVFVAVFLLPFVLRRRRLFLPVILFVCMAGLNGCGAGRTIPGATGPATTPTPDGTYTLTVSGVAEGLTHSVTLTLIVQ